MFNGGSSVIHEVPRTAMRIPLRRLCERSLQTPPTPSEGVQLWVAQLDCLQPVLDTLANLLTRDEADRATRLRIPRVRAQFVMTRGWLRLLLSRCVDISPHQVPIVYEPGGKPILCRSVNREGWHFNVSHTDGLAVFALARRARVGVDVERVRPMANAVGLVERFFASEERETFRALPDALRLQAFFCAWTRKEAFLKALGEGVQSFERCAVTMHPSEPPCVLNFDGDRQVAQRWALGCWEPAPGFRAAVAVESFGPPTYLVVVE